MCWPRPWRAIWAQPYATTLVTRIAQNDKGVTVDYVGRASKPGATLQAAPTGACAHSAVHPEPDQRCRPERHVNAIAAIAPMGSSA